MSLIKTGLTLAVGVVVGIAIKSIKDMEKDDRVLTHTMNQEQEIANLLSDRYRVMVESALPGLVIECAEEEEADKAMAWEQGVSAVVYGTCYNDLKESHYSNYVKSRVEKELDVLFNKYKAYK